MNWDGVGAVAEIIAAIGVIFSLLYVGRQLKQSNSMARSATRQEISSSMNSWAMSVASSTSLAEAIAKVNYQDLVREGASDVEKIQISYALFAVISQQHFMYEQWKEGVITERELNGLLGPQTPLLSKPYLGSVWSYMRLGFPSDFIEWYESRFQLYVED